MLDRRAFLASSAALLALPSSRGNAMTRLAAEAELEQFIRAKMRRDHIPGVAACLLSKEGIRWAGTYGMADLERKVPMTVDGLQNICSISKTFTATAVMQQRDAGKLELDDDVGDHLPFPIRNPNHPKAKITIRHLLTHRSSIRDGIAYAQRYACGDPSLSLADWMRGYFTEPGTDYDAKENFHPWAPERGWEYCNLAFGVLAYVVESVSGKPFAAYCRERIFAPLGMPETSWYLRDIDASRHVVPYTWVDRDKARGPTWGGVAQGVIRPAGASAEVKPGFNANCPYNHPNFPDGFLRTSVNQLSRYARAYLNGGALGSARILEAATVKEMLSQELLAGTHRRVQGLTWYATTRVREQPDWGHGGSDPGINTDLRLLPAEGIGAIAFMNTNGVRPDEITERILTLAPALLAA
jgi:CubicO group peptidase (beta-lactamase class C family)